MFEEIIPQLNICREQIQEALCRSKRSDKVELVAVTKTRPCELVQFLSDNKLVNQVGENHAQEIVAKYPFGSDLIWNMIGQLQTNKVRTIVDKVSLVQSLDRMSLAQELDKQAEKLSKKIDCLIELNFAGEQSKGGVEKSKLFEFAQSLDTFEHLNVRGLMTVMPKTDEKKLLIDYYKEMRDIYLQFKEKFDDGSGKISILSCGMSNDFELAIEYGGSNMVRIGRKIFGERL
ncbi:MAG: YggS family pyridoxal phosphate-dependent enzyme [Clostridia bacterium]